MLRELLFPQSWRKLKFRSIYRGITSTTSVSLFYTSLLSNTLESSFLLPSLVTKQQYWSNLSKAVASSWPQHWDSGSLLIVTLDLNSNIRSYNLYTYDCWGLPYNYYIISKKLVQPKWANSACPPNIVVSTIFIEKAYWDSMEYWPSYSYSACTCTRQLWHTYMCTVPGTTSRCSACIMHHPACWSEGICFPVELCAWTSCTYLLMAGN